MVFLYVLLFFLRLTTLDVSAQEVGVAISEVLWAGSDLSTADEWVEITGFDPAGAGLPPRSLLGWTLTSIDSSGTEEVITTFGDRTIGSGEVVLISNYGASDSRLAVTPDVVTTNMVLPNTKLLVRLRTSTGLIVDEVDDGVGAPFAGSNDLPKASMERVSLGGSGKLATHWATASTFRGYDDGAPMRGTPGFSNFTGPSSDTFAPIEATNVLALTRSGSLTVSWTPSISLDLASQLLTVSPALSDGTSLLSFGKTSTGLLTSSISQGSIYSFLLTSVDDLGNTSAGVSFASIPFPEVFITEVLANPIGEDTHEWIEVGNPGSTTVDIGGWILDEGNSPGSYTIPSPFLLVAGQHYSFRKSVTGLPLGNDGENLSLKWGSTLVDFWSYPETAEEVSYGRDPVLSSDRHAFCVPSEGIPNNNQVLDPKISIQAPAGYPVGASEVRGEQKISLNVQAVVLSGSLASATCQWAYSDGFVSSSCNPVSHTFSQVGTHKVTLSVSTFCGNTLLRELIVLVLPEGSLIPSSSSDIVQGSGGESALSEGCKPGAATGVLISEFLPDPEGDDAEAEWIELQNPLEVPLSLCGYLLDDSDGGSKPYAFDASTTLSPRSYLLVPISSSKLKLNNDGDHIRLFFGEHLLEDISYPKALKGHSYAKGLNGSFSWVSLPTPGNLNFILHASSDLTEPFSKPSSGSTTPAFDILNTIIIHEIYPSPSLREKHNSVMVSSSNHDKIISEEWVELQNLSSEPLSLSGFILDDIQDGGSKPYIFDSSAFIDPNSYILVPSSVSQLKLNNDGDEVWLLSASSEVLDHVTYPKIKHGFSFARVDSPLGGSLIRSRFCISDTPTPVSSNRCLEVSLKNSDLLLSEKDLNKGLKPILRSKNIFNKHRTRYRYVLSGFLGNDREYEAELSPLFSALKANVMAPSPSPLPAVVRQGRTEVGTPDLRPSEALILTATLLVSLFCLSLSLWKPS